MDSYCELHAYVPATDGESYRVQGEITCSSSTEMYLTVCSQVYNTNGTWYVVNSSCVPDGPPNNYQYETFYGTSTGSNPYYGKWEKGVCGHEYRTFDEGSDAHIYPTGYEYWSSGETQC
jgi:hypothetical protein